MTLRPVRRPTSWPLTTRGNLLLVAAAAGLLWCALVVIGAGLQRIW